MTTPLQAREAPAKSILTPGTSDPAFPDVGDPDKPNFEPVLDINNIQDLRLIRAPS